jgi:hypothetical protein
MAEIAIGAIPTEPVGPIAFELETDWQYTISIEPIEQQELTSVRVLVEQTIDPGNTFGSHQLASFEIIRWVAEPEVYEEEGLLGESSDSEDASPQGSESSSSGGEGGDR